MPRMNFGPFTLDAPTDWTLTTLVLAGPPDAAPKTGMLTTKAVRPFQQNLIVTMEQVPGDETPESYVQRQQDGLTKAGVQRKETAKPEKVKIEGRSGLLTEQSVIGPGGEQVRQLQLVNIKDGIAYTLIATHLDGASYEKAKDNFRKMLLSFV